MLLLKKKEACDSAFMKWQGSVVFWKEFLVKKKRRIIAALIVLALSAGIYYYIEHAAFLPEHDWIDAREADSFSLEEISEYSGEPYTVVHDNVPYFTAEDLTAESYERYSELDALGRCGVAQACIGLDLMPVEERGGIGQIKPSGWQTAAYDFIDGRYLYNRCHLIAFALAGENANEANLITGTRYLNVQGMLPFETAVMDYVRSSGYHVLYRVTPIFKEEELLARGVLLEAYSVEDDGESVQFCVYCYNVQPGVWIDYMTGENCLDEEYFSSNFSPEEDYVLNSKTRKFHFPDCSGVETMREENRQNFHGSRELLLAQGYEPCGTCCP